jgi:hypothetical protein
MEKAYDFLGGVRAAFVPVSDGSGCRSIFIKRGLPNLVAMACQSQLFSRMQA